MIALISLAFNRVMWGYKLLGGLTAILIGLALVSEPLFGAYLLAADRAVDAGRRRAAGRFGPGDRGTFLCKLDAHSLAGRPG